MPGLGVFYVAHLRVGQVEKLGQLCPVGSGLVKEQQKFRVGEHKPGRFGTQTFLDVLRGGCQGRAVFAPAFPGAVSVVKKGKGTGKKILTKGEKHVAKPLEK